MQDLNILIETLHPLERKVLPFLKENKSLQVLLKKINLSEVEVTRALQWLNNKKIINLSKPTEDLILLDKNGKRYSKEGLPERRFLEIIKNSSLSLKEIQEKTKLDNNELSISLGVLKSKAAIDFDKEKISLTENGKKLLEKSMLEEDFLKRLSEGLSLDKLKDEDKFCLEKLKKRKEIIKIEREKDLGFELTELGKKIINKKLELNLIESLSPQMLINNSWKDKRFRRYDIKVEVPKVSGGRRHFVNEAKAYIRKIWLDMGFKEMTGNLIQTSFWNFDSLFVPQDHPAREMQDTFFVSGKKSIENKEFIPKVKKSHEDNWKYKWNLKEAEKLVLRTHTTVLSAQTLAKLKKEDLPSKFFAVGKNFRNEVVDWSHLFELIQVEGIVIDEEANFRNLIAYLKEFFGKMGFSKIRIRPAYFPYTEPSAEVDVYHPVKKKWVELGGSGIFRPEVTKPLLGKETPVLAWGLGLDRTIMDYFLIKDIRNLYKNDLKQLKEIKSWI